METPMRRANSPQSTATSERHLIDLIHIGAFHAIGMECLRRALRTAQLLRHVGATGPQFVR